MRKKIVGIIVCMLLISSTTTIVLFSDTAKVEASGGGQQGGGCVNLDYDWVWERVQDFGNVIHNVNWSENGENGIPRGRAWATAGENYTRDTILWPKMGPIDNPCGLTNYTNLSIGYINSSAGYIPPLRIRPKQYSSKIVVTNYGLSIYNNSIPYRTLPYSELFPIPVGARCLEFLLTKNYTISEAKVVDVPLSLWGYIADHCNVSGSALNEFDTIAGKVVFLGDSDPVPENQSSFVFIFNENQSCENKIENITDASVILIQNKDRGYTFPNASALNFSIMLINGSDDNFTKVKNEVNNGSIYVVDNVANSQILVFSNFSNDSCFCPQQWVGVHKRLAPSNPDTYCKAIGWDGGAYYDLFRIILWEKIFRWAPRCRGLILSDFTDTHFMTHSVTDWSWFSKFYSDRYWMPTFSVNRSIGNYLLDYKETVRIDGFINQTYRQQNETTPGVESYNVIAYRNITNSPNNAIAVLSNRMDGWWGATPGDSGVGGAILLGIAKYFHDYNITPKYNLAFLFTTGEEYGMRGAQHFVDSHPYEDGDGDYNYVHFIGFDQLGFDFTESEPKNFSLEISTKDSTMRKILLAITNQTDYRNKTGYNRTVFDEPAGGSEDYVWQENCANTVCFGKDSVWDGYHRTGMNFSKGDSLDYIDRNDVNVTFELAWNVTKYFTVNPDCWFNNTPTYQLWDSNHDSKMDSVNVSFSVNTILPHDRIWVKATLVSEKYPRYYRFTTEKNYIITPSGVQDTLTVTLPREAPQDYYSLKVYLYNSTGEIDRRCSYPLTNYWDFKLGCKYTNEAYEQGPFWMHPANLTALTPEQPSGDDDIMVGIPHFYTTSTTDPEGDPIWYQWNYETSLGEMFTCWRGPYNSGQGDTKLFSWISPGIYNVSVRAKYLWNPNVKSDWSEVLPVTVSPWFGDPVEWNSDLLDDLSQTVLAVGQQTYSNGFAPGVSVKSATRESLNWTWEFGDGNVSYGENVSHSYSQVGNYRVILRIRNSQGYYYNCSKNVMVLLLNAGFTTQGDIQGGKTALFNDTSAGEYQMENWSWDFGDGTVSYQRNTSHVYAADGVYNVTLTVRDIENNTHFVLQQVVVESAPPQFIHVAAEPDIVGFGFPVTISADVYEDYVENQSGVRDIWVNLTYPDNTTQSFPMNLNVSSEHDYTFTFNDTWQAGVYNYSIYVNDYANNTNTTGLNFTVSAEANINVCTTKDTYTSNEYINLTDPPGTPAPSLGYELLDDGAVLHLWNQYDSYYFNTSSGIQLTNHKDDYWSHNVLMLGYYNNDQWNLMYRTDELTGFSQAIETDNTTYVNSTLWKDLTYAGFQFRLALRYHLGVNDHDLTVIPSIKNIGTNNIPCVLGFGWELKDIQINMTSQGDYILADQDKFFLNQTLDNSYTSLNETVVYLMEDVTDSQTKSLYLRWNQDLTYKLLVKSRTGQTNAPVTLFIRIGTLAAGQQKSTSLQWYDASQQTFYFNGFDGNEAWETKAELMTDGDVETFASTSIESDTQLCNENTCEGEDQGEILKVEIRAHGYHEGEQGNITLVPVFGENRGENYMFVTFGQSEWSPWFDITDDEGRGTGQGPSSSTWNWSEVTALACLVSSDVEDATLFCSMVELRVTYNTAPVVSNPSPPYGVNGVGLQPWVNITVSDPNGDSMNVTWYSNSTPTLLTLRPNMNGSIAELQRYPTAENANYKCVDETIVDDNDYVYWSGTSWKKDSYNLANHGTASGVIKNVTVYARCNREGFGLDPGVPNAGKIVIKSGSSYYDGNEFTPTSTFTSYSHTWSVNPSTGTAWDWSAIDSLEAGVAFIGNEAGDSKCSQVYVVVTYVNQSTWLQFGSNSSVNNGVYRQRFLNASVNGQWWYWTVKADDGILSTWSSVYKFYTGYQSKIENTGSTDIKGYLLMQVQYYNETLESWIVDNDTINETTPRVINSSNQLGLDTIFNGKVQASELTHGSGLYRVYAAFRDPEENILKTDDETDLEAWWQFNKT